jgi:3-phytase
MIANDRLGCGRVALWSALCVETFLTLPIGAADGAPPLCEPTVTLLSAAVRDQDDTCVWQHPTAPAMSTVITSDKSAGQVFVYDLQGRLLQSVPVSKPGNIDLRRGFTLGGEAADIVVVNQRSDGFRLAVFKIDPARRYLDRIDDGDLLTGPNYGGCLYQSRRSGKCYFVATSEEGAVEQFELRDKGRGRISAKRVRHWPLGKCEGAVADDERGRLYIAEESKGVWQLGAEPDDAAPGELIIKVGEHGIVGDLEGIVCFRGPDGRNYLVFSDQGANQFPVFRVDGAPEFTGRFRVKGAEDTDGIELVRGDLGPQFPAGLFACHADQSPCPILLVPVGRVFSALGIGNDDGRRSP